MVPRGETEWARNIRVSRTARLTLGRTTETVPVEEVPDSAKPPILRAYLKEWAWEVNQFFGGVRADSPDTDLAHRGQAPRVPHRSVTQVSWWAPRYSLRLVGP